MTEYSSADGHAVADHNDTPPPAAATQAAPIHDSEISEIAAVPVNAIVASPFNPRRANHAPLDLGLIRAKSVEEGNCWLWQGAMHTGMPVIRHNGKVVNVRRIIAQEFLYIDVDGKLATARCGNGKCCAPEHVDVVTRQTLQRRTIARTQFHQRVTFKEKAAQAARARSPLDHAMVDAIRADERPGREIADELGVAHSTVQHIRSHRNWKDYRSPFAGLLA